MRALLDGLLTVFKHLFMRKVTLEYPEKKRFQSDAFRGKPMVNIKTENSNENNYCVGCGVCKRVCPSNAIEYVKNDAGEVVSYTFNLKKCIFCGNCMYYCPHSAIKLTSEFELASEDKSNLMLTYRGGADDK